MLPPFIIEQIRRREQEKARRDYQQPTLRIPSTLPPRRSDDTDLDNEDDPERGVVIIDLG